MKIYKISQALAERQVVVDRNKNPISKDDIVRYRYYDDKRGKYFLTAQTYRVRDVTSETIYVNDTHDGSNVELTPEECVVIKFIGKDKSKLFEPATYAYHINLNERGSFYADVRNTSGKTVFTIKAGNELGPDETSIFEDGFMKHIHDMDGLKQHLVSLGIMKPDQTLTDMDPNER